MPVLLRTTMTTSILNYTSLDTSNTLSLPWLGNISSMIGGLYSISLSNSLHSSYNLTTVSLASVQSTSRFTSVMSYTSFHVDCSVSSLLSSLVFSMSSALNYSDPNTDTLTYCLTAWLSWYRLDRDSSVAYSLDMYYLTSYSVLWWYKYKSSLVTSMIVTGLGSTCMTIYSNTFTLVTCMSYLMRAQRDHSMYPLCLQKVSSEATSNYFFSLYYLMT